MDTDLHGLGEDNFSNRGRREKKKAKGRLKTALYISARFGDGKKVAGRYR
jgi:hypothetical protein